VHASKICKTCAIVLTCVVCKRAKLKTKYSDWVWNHQKTRKHHRCLACFICRRCPPDEVHDLCDFEFGANICKRCDTLTCSACRKQVEKQFGKKYRDASVTLCQACVEQGCTMKDKTVYRCDECSQKLGGQRFQQLQLQNFNYRANRDRLTCKTCVSQRPQRLTKLRPRVLRSKRRCHCNRHSAPGMHLESSLASDKELSRRWPGSDEGVTVDDFRFLQRWQPAWWSKALGKATTR